MMLWTAISLLFAFGYIAFIFWIESGWRLSADKAGAPNLPEASGLSVIIPCRNEESQITRCLESISHCANKQFPLELIVIDDHSDDKTVLKVEEWQQQSRNNITLKLLHARSEGKKAALLQGIHAAAYDTILTTDADCVYHKQWLTCMKGTFDACNLQMLCGPVKLEYRSGFEKLQAIESAGLVAMGAATLQHLLPTTCNGANLMYSRNAFESVGGFADNIQVASGDDEFLMHKMFTAFPGKVAFCHKQEAMVYTAPASSWSSFVSQRVRWASKGRFYTNKTVLLLQLQVALFLMSILANACLAFVSDIAMVLLLFQLAAKLFADRNYFSSIAGFFGLTDLKAYSWLTGLYQLYIIPVAIRSLFGPAKWKGRV